MSIPTNEKRTIGIILGVIFPGVGHIYIGNKKEQTRGITIAVVFVIVSFIGRYIQIGIFDVSAFVMLGIWIWQIWDLIKITERDKTLEPISHK